ncbi:hypothetical protein PV669_16455 [Clostridioides difficile]|nr:hypothetical protein [Clostridioides difficile]MCL6901983.1 hypothetical protein [Clostridioides difficile]MCP3377837.1 hypothetical protein [Clostridioides difficile]MDE3493467.1 hypothetical protein [Clostridioides difficile]MDE3707882.1 hypothetical protein [Clostridioides difficile]
MKEKKENNSILKKKGKMHNSIKKIVERNKLFLGNNFGMDRETGIVIAIMMAVVFGLMFTDWGKDLMQNKVLPAAGSKILSIFN